MTTIAPIRLTFDICTEQLVSQSYPPGVKPLIDAVESPYTFDCYSKVFVRFGLVQCDVTRIDGQYLQLVFPVAQLWEK